MLKLRLMKSISQILGKHQLKLAKDRKLFANSLLRSVIMEQAADVGMEIVVTLKTTNHWKAKTGILKSKARAMMGMVQVKIVDSFHLYYTVFVEFFDDL